MSAPETISTGRAVQQSGQLGGPDSLRGRFLTVTSRHYLVVVVAVLAIAVGIARPAFWGSANLANVLFSTALVGLAGCGMTLLIAGGLLDLSIAGVIAISSIAAAKVLPSTTIGGAVILAVAFGAVLGLVNGLLVTYARIAAFIATLGTLNLYFGLAFVTTSGNVVPIVSRNFRSAMTATLGPIPVVFVVFAVVAVVTYGVLNRTYFGRAVRALGSNERAAQLAGLPTKRVKVIAFVFAGMCSAIAGVFLAGRLSSAEAIMAQGIEMNVIAAVVVGGTALRGGRGTVFGTFVGALLFAVLGNALNLLGIASYWQYVLTGVVLAAAVAIGARRRDAAEVRGAA